MIFILRDNQRLSDAIQYISALPETPLWEVEIKEHKSSRSKSQNRLYWLWLKTLGDFMGETKEHLHKTFAVKFLGYEASQINYKNEDGEIMSVELVEPKSTTNLSTKEFTEYLEKIEVAILTAFEDFILPYPDDYKIAMGGE